MLIIEWLLVLPHNSGTTVVKTTVTDFGTAIDAVSRAHDMWPLVRTRENRRVSGFQIVDQDGRIIATACLAGFNGMAA